MRAASRAPVYRCQRYSERLYDISLPHRSTGDQLAGIHAEALQILLVVLKHWQQAVEIDHLSVLLLERQVLRDRRQATGKDRQLKLRDGPVSPLTAYRATTRIGTNRARAIFLDSPNSLSGIRNSESRRLFTRDRIIDSICAFLFSLYLLFS
jgi:hypothetical protein